MSGQRIRRDVENNRHRTLSNTMKGKDYRCTGNQTVSSAQATASGKISSGGQGGKSRISEWAEVCKGGGNEVDEFKWGEIFGRLDDKIVKEFEGLVAKAPEGYKNELKEGVGVAIESIRALMSLVSDGVARERAVREREEVKINCRVTRAEVDLKEVKEKIEQLREDTVRAEVIRSERDMEEKVKAACCSIKVSEMRFHRAMDDKREMVKEVISNFKQDVFSEDWERYECIMRKTRIVILGRRTETRTERGNTYYTVPVLLEVGNRWQAEELGEIIRRAGYFIGFQWPREAMDFIGGVRDEVRAMGFGENNYFVRVRPEVRGEQVEIGAEVKNKSGGKWQMKGYWKCPPLDRKLWEMINNVYKGRIVGEQRN
jgi:DNA-binding transcriptional MerR regulator